MKKMKMAIALLCTLIAVSTEALFAQTTVDFSKLATTLEKNKKKGAEFISEIPYSEIVIQEDGTLLIPQLETTVSIVPIIDTKYLGERMAQSGKKSFKIKFAAKDMKAVPKIYAVSKIEGIMTAVAYMEAQKEAQKEAQLEEQRNANEAAGFGRVTNAERAVLEAERAVLEAERAALEAERAALEAELVANDAAGFGRVTNEVRQFLEQEKADFFENPEKYFNMTVNANNTVSITSLKKEAVRSLHCIYIPGDISGIPVVDVNVEYIGYREDSTWIPSSIVFLDVPASVKSISVKLGSLSIINIAKNSRLEEIELNGTCTDSSRYKKSSTHIDANFDAISNEFSLAMYGYEIDKFILPKKCKEFSGSPIELIIDSSVNKLTIGGSDIKEITTAKNANKNLKELVLNNIGNDKNHTNLDISNSAIETLSIHEGQFNDISLPASIKRIIQTSSGRTYLDTIHIPESVKQIVFWCKWGTRNGIDQACPENWWMFSTSSAKTQIELRRVGYIGTFTFTF